MRRRRVGQSAHDGMGCSKGVGWATWRTWWFAGEGGGRGWRRLRWGDGTSEWASRRTRKAGLASAAVGGLERLFTVSAWSLFTVDSDGQGANVWWYDGSKPGE